MKKNYTLGLFFILFCLKIHPQSSTVVSDIQLPRSLVLVGNELYIAENAGFKISKINITDPTPIAMDVVTGLDSPRAIEINGNDLYIAESDKVSKIDITSPNPIATDVVTGLNNPVSIKISGNYLFVAEYNSNKISKINITDSTPTPTDVITGVTVLAIYVYGDDLYMAQNLDNKISKIDITDAMPVLTDVITGISKPNALLIEGNSLFITQIFDNGQNFDNKISKTDINATIPVATDVVTGLYSPVAMVLNGNDFYIAENTVYRIVKFTSSSLSVDKNVHMFNVLLYPNPSNDFIILSNLNETKKYKVFNSVGIEEQNGNISNNQKINIEQLSNGLHILVLNDGNALKFIKN